MKASILDITGKEKAKIDLPSSFSEKVREDIIAKVLGVKKSKQPYSPSPVAGNQASARGKLKHRRHVWKSQYGRGMSRVPRKTFSRRGTQFNWEAASVPFARGGIRAHPPKVISMINTKKVNKKELISAFHSALSATANQKEIINHYATLKDKKIDKLENLPFVVESKITTLKSKELVDSIEKILGKKLYELALRKKSVRSGRGKLRGRKYKTTSGILIVTGSNEKLKTKMFDVVNVKSLGINDLARGGPGRLTLYTEEAIKNLKGPEGGNKK